MRCVLSTRQHPSPLLPVPHVLSACTGRKPAPAVLSQSDSHACLSAAAAAPALCCSCKFVKGLPCYSGRYKEGDYGANAGLKVARDLLEPIKEKFPWISYADLWTLAGATAIEELGGACPSNSILYLCMHRSNAAEQR